MKYCLKYSKSSLNLKEADEIIIPFNGVSVELLDFMQQDLTKRYILYIMNEDLHDFLTGNDLKKIYDVKNEASLNIAIRFPMITDEIIEKMKDYKMDFFFETMVGTWDKLLGLINLGVSDVYIVEELGFEIDKVAQVAHEKNVSVRVYPNICQSSWRDTDSLKTFFIRPEDISVYEQYVDVCEFMGVIQKQDVYFDIYAKDKEWYGPLHEVIIGFKDETLDNKQIIPRFPDRRINCGKSCFKGGKCAMCERIVDLSKILEKTNLVVVHNKKEENNG